MIAECFLAICAFLGMKSSEWEAVPIVVPILGGFSYPYLKHTKKKMRKASAEAADAFPLLIQLIVKSLHPFRRFLPHGLGHVAVDIQGELSCRMAQVCLDGLDVIACVEGGDGEGVSEVVETGFLHTGTLGDLFEVLHNGATNEMLADGVGKDQIHGVAPAGSGEGFGGLLLLPLLLQSLHDHGGWEDGAASAAFGRLQEVFPVLALELLLDGDDAGIEDGGGRGNGTIVDILPDAVQLQKAGALNNGLLRDGGKLLPDIVDKERICLRVDGMDDAGGYGILDLSLGILQLVGSQGNVRGNGTADDPQYILDGRPSRGVFTDHQAAFRCEYTEVCEPEQAIIAINKEASLFRTKEKAYRLVGFWSTLLLWEEVFYLINIPMSLNAGLTDFMKDSAEQFLAFFTFDREGILATPVHFSGFHIFLQLRNILVARVCKQCQTFLFRIENFDTICRRGYRSEIYFDLFLVGFNYSRGTEA